MALLTIAALTLREASRRKLLLAVAGLTVLAAILVGWGFSRIPTLHCSPPDCGAGFFRSVESVLLILVAYMFSVIIAVAAPFLAAPSIAGEIESHVILGILPRPIRRSDVVLGKWLGLAVLVACYTVFAAALQFIAVDIAVGYVPPHPASTILFIICEAVALMTLALLGSTRLAPITCGIISVILFFMAWMVGIAGQIGAAFGNSVVTNIGIASSLILPTDGLWRGAIFNMEPVAIITAVSSTHEARVSSANPFTVASPPTTAYVIWSICWIALVLGLAVRSFSTREV